MGKSPLSHVQNVKSNDFSHICLFCWDAESGSSAFPAIRVRCTPSAFCLVYTGCGVSRTERRAFRTAGVNAPRPDLKHKSVSDPCCRTDFWSSRLHLSESQRLFCCIVMGARSLILLLFLWAICLSAEPLFSIRLFIFGTQLTRGERLFPCLFISHKSHCIQYLIMCCWITHLCLFSLFEDMLC